MKVQSLVLCIVASLLSACVSTQPTIEPKAAVDLSSGYIAGVFTRTNSGGFAFIIRNLETNAEFQLSLGEDGVWPKDVKNQVLMIKVPAGKYSVVQWIHYGTLTSTPFR